MTVEPFLTSYDPSDLPGGSIDPLGFERGYLFLADKILPGLTAVASKPRYFSVLCAGAYVAEVSMGLPARKQYEVRLETVKRFERLWALANVLAAREHATREQGAGEQEAREYGAETEGLDNRGLRGVTDAGKIADRLQRHGNVRTDADFRLLSNQVRYGAIGIYGAVAAGMRLWDRRTLSPTPDLGGRLAEGFLKDTGTPTELKRAVREGSKVRLTVLAEWGKRAHICAEVGETEAGCMREAAHRDATRSRMLQLLAEHPWHDQDTELARLERIASMLADTDEHADLREALEAIIDYESTYRHALLGFERLLFLCRQHVAVEDKLVESDDVLDYVRERLPALVSRLGVGLDPTNKTGAFRHNLGRTDDVRSFVTETAAACAINNRALADTLMKRHQEVQHGKFDRGRRKLPWIHVQSGAITLTMTRAGGIDEPESTDQVSPHPYRLDSADALIAAGGEA